MGEESYEIELKSLLTKDKYDELCSLLPGKMKLFNEETIHTTRYRPGDVRLRHSNKTNEVICKEGDASNVTRKEITVPMKSKEELDRLAGIFSLIGLKHDPSWVKHKQEFKYKFKGYEYIVCLQNIEKFAYILEVEFISSQDDTRIHEPNIRAIFEELGCEAINEAEFNEKIKDYIKKNQ